MQKEPRMKETSHFDPSVDSHRPASGKSQDISHVLASTFKHLYTKDVIGKDTLFNLIKTKSGRGSDHEKYVMELQQAHSEYSRCIKEADMLESHIIQARAQAAATESQTYERLKEGMDDLCGQLGLFTVNSVFAKCVDQDLLKMNNLISPQDYLPTQTPRVRAPAPIKSNPGKHTIASAMHVSEKYQGTVSPKKVVPEMNESDVSLTLESSSAPSRRKRTPMEKPDQIITRPKWKDEPSVNHLADGWEKLQQMKDRHNFLRNPRFLPPKAQQGVTFLVHPRTKGPKVEHVRKGGEKQSSTENSGKVFRAKPSEVIFTDYSVGQVYEITLELNNVTPVSRPVRVLPPTTPYFSIGLGRFPGEGSVVAPGMSCKYTVRFAPDSLGDYMDYIVVEIHAGHQFCVPITATRPPPILTLPKVLKCGCCLIGGVKFIEFVCQNVSLSAGTFCIIPKNQWPASNYRSVARTHFSEEAPFAVSPSLFVLLPGEATVLEVVFFPTTAERSSRVFTVVCDNCQVKDISIEGEGQMIALELLSVSGKEEHPVVGEVRDLTAEHFVRFSPCNPHSMQQKRIIIRNNVHLELPFHWQIMKPNLHPSHPEETPEPSHIQFHLATDDAFNVSPLTGVLPPGHEQEFTITFSPKELKDYHSVCHLVLIDVPQLPTEPIHDSVLQPVRTGSKLGDVIVMEIEVKGSTEPYKVILEPYAVVIPGEIFICSTTRRQFKMWNHSKTRISFQWERISSNSHIIEVEPSAGSIEENECFDFDLMLSGEKPERVVTSLVCSIEHHHEPVTLLVEVSFKGPVVILSVPSVDFGLTKLGERTQTALHLTNITQMEASWTLKERLNGQRDHQEDTQISVEPHMGVLPPFASCSVDVLFSPRFCQRYETELELTVENGTGCHLWVQADVQSPQVCLLNCELLFSELYIGVAAEATVTIFNQTLLPSHFSWMAQLQGKQGDLCTTSFDPSSGTLGPNASLEIKVNFITHTDLDLTEVAALCEVQGMNSPLVVGITACKTRILSVSYSQSSVCSPPEDGSPSTLLLDFCDNVICSGAVTKQFLITNQTAIPAPFHIEPDYFNCYASKPDNQSEKRKMSYVQKPLHSVQAEKVEEQAHKDFVSSLLAHRKGAAFFVVPDTGVLGPFETQTVDVTAYTDMWGEYRDHLICKVGDLQPTLIPMQMTVTGCPLYFQMTGPRPDNQYQGPKAQFGTHLSGGDTMSRSYLINNPTMFNIRLDWEIYNIDRDDHKLVDLVVAYGDAFPVKDADGNKVLNGALSVQTAWERNKTSGSEGTSSRRCTMTGGEAEEYVCEDDCEEKETRLYPSPAKKKLMSVHIRPHVGKLSDYPFCITPQQLVVPAKSSRTIHVSFTPLTLSGSVCESTCVGLAQGYMSLDSEMSACVPGKVGRAQGLDLEPVTMDLLGVVKTAALSVQLEEDERVLEFYASASDLVKAESKKLVVCEFESTRDFQLRNCSEMPLHFRLETQPPFRVIRPHFLVLTSTSIHLPARVSKALVLHPKQSMQVKVAFKCSLPLLDHADQTGKDVPPGVTLLHQAGEGRMLRFQQNLLIHYSNNSVQTVPLCARLDLPTMSLSSDIIDFGFCFVGQTQMKEVNLYGQGALTYWKSIIESNERDARVFRVTPDFGLLRSKDFRVPSCSQCLQISFTPSKVRRFKAIVVIHSPLLKTRLTVQLQGTGSFDQAYRSNSISFNHHSPTIPTSSP